MPLPGLSDVHINVPLTNLSQAIIQQEDNFVAWKLFPIVPVNKRSDAFYIFTQADFFRTDATRRAVAASTPGVGYHLSNSTYTATPWGVHFDIDDQIRGNADSVLDLDIAAVPRPTIDLLIRRESDWQTNSVNARLRSTVTHPPHTCSNVSSKHNVSVTT